MHVVQVPFTYNISKKYLMFFLKSSRIGVGCPVVIFNLFRIVLIRTETPCNVICQCSYPSVYEVINDI